MAKVLVLYYSSYGHIETMAQAVAEGAREARKKRAALPILFVTGYADSLALREISEERIVQKPFRDGELAAKVRAVLAAA